MREKGERKESNDLVYEQENELNGKHLHEIKL